MYVYIRYHFIIKRKQATPKNENKLHKNDNKQQQKTTNSYNSKKPTICNSKPKQTVTTSHTKVQRQTKILQQQTRTNYMYNRKQQLAISAKDRTATPAKDSRCCNNKRQENAIASHKNIQ